MSSRITSDFGSLGDRTLGTTGKGADPTQRTRWVEVDDGCWLPGVLVAWSRSPAGWMALVAWVAEDHLKVSSVPSSKVRPAQ